MKTLFLIRHAKSSWASIGLRDIERTLEQRGHNDAPRMAKHLKKLGIQPDLLVSSPAVRARTTADYFAKEFNIASESIDIQQDIYEADEQTILHIIHELPDSVETVFMFGHNPTFTYVADSFSKTTRFDNVPTCGVVQICSNTEGGAWKNFGFKTADVKGFWFPKGINALIFICLICLFSCKHEGKAPLSADTFASILTDMHIAEAAAEAEFSTTKDSLLKNYYGQILKKHNVSSSDFDSTMAVYSRQPVVFDSLYSDVLRRIEKIDTTTH